MKNIPIDSLYVATDQLCVGLYVHLDMSWMNHSFAFSSFKITQPDQIQKIRELGIKRVRIEPARSSVKPLPSNGVASTINASHEPEVLVEIQVSKEKRERIEKLGHIREDLRRVEKQFKHASDTIKNINRNLISNPQETVRQAELLADQMVESMLAEGTVLMHALNGKVGEEAYFHSLNVSVLSLMLAKSLDFSADDSKHLCMGAMFHDIGKLEVPAKILMKTDPLTKPEAAFLEQHCDFGIKLAKRSGLSEQAIEIIANHHELVDGSGYPRGLKGDKLSQLARIVSMVNLYDNICNPANIANAVTPHEALSNMFAVKRHMFDEVALKTFIRCLGVYPPGSIVQLSNEMLGLVLYVNSNKPLRPTILIYDPNIPKEEAMIVDLTEETEINITKGLRPGQLSREVYQYLSPRKHVTYFFDPQNPSTQH